MARQRSNSASSGIPYLRASLAWIEYDVQEMTSFLIHENGHSMQVVRAAYEAVGSLGADMRSRAPFGTVLATPDDIGRIQDAARAAMRSVSAAIQALHGAGNGSGGST